MLPWCRATSSLQLIPVKARQQAWTLLLCLRHRQGASDAAPVLSLDMLLHMLQFFRVGDLVALTPKRVLQAMFQTAAAVAPQQAQPTLNVHLPPHVPMQVASNIIIIRLRILELLLKHYIQVR